MSGFRADSVWSPSAYTRYATLRHYNTRQTTSSDGWIKRQAFSYVPREARDVLTIAGGRHG